MSLPEKRNSRRWRRLHDDPNTALGWVFRFDRRFLGFQWVWFVCGIAFWGLVLVGAYLVKRWMGRPFDPVTFLGPMVVTIAGAWNFRKRTAEAHGALPSVDQTLKAVPVVLDIQSDSFPAVREIGWVSLHDGWLAYEGLRSSFFLSRDSIVQQEKLKEATRLRLDDGRALRFSLLNDATESDFVDAPVDPRLPRVHRKPSPFVQRIARPLVSFDLEDSAGGVDLPALFAEWLEQPAATGSAIYPPEAPHPECVAQGLGRWFALSAACSLAVPFCLLAQSWPWALCFGAVAVGALLWFLIGLRKFQRELPGMIG